MGLVIDSIKFRENLNDISYKLEVGKITGIYGDNANYLIDIINGDYYDYDGEVLYNDELIEKDFYKKNPSLIGLIDSSCYFYTNKVEEEFKFNLGFRNIEVEDLDKVMKKYLDLVGLNLDYKDRYINTLSSSEKYLLLVAINLCYEPKIILFKDIFWGIDRNNRKIITTIIKNLREDDKIVILTHKDTNILYELVDDVILLDGTTLYNSGSSDKLFTSTELMKENVIPMPYITKVTYLAKNKKVKLTYHKDVRDIIKDIYKHV